MTQLWPTDHKRKSTQFASASAILLLLSFSFTIVFGLSHDEPVLKPYPTVTRPAFIEAPDPIYAVRTGIAPNVGESTHPKPSQNVRAIVVYPTGAVLYRGGVPSQVVPLSGGTNRVTLHELVAAINDPTWIEEHDDVATVHSPLITIDPTEFIIDGAQTSRVILDSPTGAFLGAAGGSFTTKSVTISGSSTKTQTPTSEQFRPFFEANGVDAPVTLKISNTRFEHLGWDWHSSYGVSLVGAVHGSISNSTVTKCYFGLYTEQLHEFSVHDSTFSRNTVYGIDLHTGSSDLTIARNTATQNASHGIVGSVDVRNSVITGNTSSLNGEDGIVLDERSDHNVVRNNVVTKNTGDGIAVTGSRNEQLLSNIISNNRIGIRVSANSSAHAKRNVVMGNVLPAQGIALSTTANVIDRDHNVKTVPPSRWHFLINYLMWPATALTCLIAILIRRRERQQFVHYRFSNDPMFKSENS